MTFYFVCLKTMGRKPSDIYTLLNILNAERISALLTSVSSKQEKEN
jgi:hypothetical protein